MSVDPNMLLILKSNQLGDGEIDLGEKLLKSFLTVLEESEDWPARIVCINSGVFLTTEGSPVKNILSSLADGGVEIFSCSTCLEYYGRTDKLVVGQPTNMAATLAAMKSFGKVLTP